MDVTGTVYKDYANLCTTISSHSEISHPHINLLSKGFSKFNLAGNHTVLH